MLKFCFLFFMSLATLGNGVFAQSKDEKAVAQAVEKLRTAMIDANASQLNEITCEKLSYGHSSGKVEDKASFVTSLTSGASDFVSMDLTDQTISVVNNTALVRHKLAGKIMDGGKPGEVKLNVLLVWVKNKGQWQLLARQAVR